MSSRSRRAAAAAAAAPEPEPAPPAEVEYALDAEGEPDVETEAESDPNQVNGMDMSKNEGMIIDEEDDKKTDYTNIPNAKETMPDFESKNADQLREWLRHHNVKGTWAKKLLTKCKDVWDDMMVIARNRALLAGSQMEEPIASADEEEPNFQEWTLDRKRAFLRRRDVKGIWEKYLSEKCSEIWRMEKAGEKYIHTPPSLGRPVKGRYPGGTLGSMQVHHAIPMHMAHIHSGHPNHPIITSEPTPLTISPSDFTELAGAAQKSDLKQVTELLNHWSAKNMLPEEPQNMTIEEASAHTTHNGEGVELRWVHSEVTSNGLVRSKAKRAAASPSTPSKRKRVASGQAVNVEGLEGEEGMSDEMNGLQARIRDLEAQVVALQAENSALQKK